MTLFLLGGFGVMVVAYLLTTFYMRRRDGVQPSHKDVLIMATFMGCCVLVFYVLDRFGISLQHGQSRNIFSFGLGILLLVLALWTTHERRSSGTVLMDLGRSPLFKLHMGLTVLMAVMAVGFAFYPESRGQAFGYATWSAWFFVMARGRFEVRDRGIIIGSLLKWNRIARCVATDDNKVRLNLSKGIKRTVDLKLPADRRDEFIQLVNSRKAA
jgi:hypothetical protein